MYFFNVDFLFFFWQIIISLCFNQVGSYFFGKKESDKDEQKEEIEETQKVSFIFCLFVLFLFLCFMFYVLVNKYNVLRNSSLQSLCTSFDKLKKDVQLFIYTI